MIELEKFVLAGNATFTAVSKKTGNRFTFQVQEKDKEDTQFPTISHFVKVLTGPDNWANYTNFGTVRVNGEFKHSGNPACRISKEAPSAKAFEYIWKHRNDATLPEKVEIHHEGKCCCCGRKLTTPESVVTGIGPVCAGRKGW